MLFLLTLISFAFGSLLVLYVAAQFTINDQSRQIHDLRIQLNHANMEIGQLLDAQPDEPMMYHRDLDPFAEMVKRSFMERN